MTSLITGLRTWPFPELGVLASLHACPETRTQPTTVPWVDSFHPHILEVVIRHLHHQVSAPMLGCDSCIRGLSLFLYWVINIY